MPSSITSLYSPLFQTFPIEAVLGETLIYGPKDRELLNLASEAVCQIKVARNQLLVAGIWLYAGDLNAAHSLVQDMTSDSANWWHAILHRMEGDYTNSRYWYRQSESHPARKESTDADSILDWAESSDPRCIDAQRKEWMLLMDWIITGGCS